MPGSARSRLFHFMNDLPIAAHVEILQEGAAKILKEAVLAWGASWGHVNIVYLLPYFDEL